MPTAPAQKAGRPRDSRPIDGASIVSCMKYFVLALPIAGALVLGGCLGRTGITDDDLAAAGGDVPLDDTGIGLIDTGDLPGDTSVPDDTSASDTAVLTDTSIKPDTAPPPPRDSGIDFFDIFPIPDSGPIGVCATCVKDHCHDQVNACLNDPSCLKGLTCTLTKCLGGGGPGGFDFACILGCFGGDFKTAGEAIGAFTCVIGNCGAKCGGFLGGGIPGGGGTPDAGKAGGARMSSEYPAWSEAEVRATEASTRLGFSPSAFDAWRSQIQGSACEQRLAVCVADEAR